MRMKEELGREQTCKCICLHDQMDEPSEDLRPFSIRSVLLARFEELERQAI